MSGLHAPPRLAVGSLRVLVLIACLSWSMQSAAANDEVHERERIASERALVHAEFTARQRECQTRFAVTACVDAARSQQREALGRLHREELLLDDARRRQRAAERTAEIRGRVSADEARERKAAPSAPATPAPAAASSGSKSAPRTHTQRSPSHKARPNTAGHVAPGAAAQRRDRTERQAREARNAAEFEARAQAARAHRDEVERRNAERAAHGRRAAPLPASAPAS